MRIRRDEAMALARRNMPVVVKGGGAPPREVRSAKEMPPEPGDNYDGPEMEYHAMRDPDGNWTRAGLEHVLRSGGSVRHQGQLIERIDDLPGEEELAAATVQRLDAQAARIAGEIAKLSTELARVQDQRDKAEDGSKAKWEGFSARARSEAEERRDRQREQQAADNLAQSGETGTAGRGPVVAPDTGQAQQAGQAQQTGSKASAQDKAKAPGQHKKE